MQVGPFCSISATDQRKKTDSFITVYKTDFRSSNPQSAGLQKPDFSVSHELAYSRLLNRNKGRLSFLNFLWFWPFPLNFATDDTIVGPRGCGFLLP